LKFKKLRKKVAKTDAISIMLTSIGDVYENYINIDHVPHIFDEMKVKGFGSVNSMHVPGCDILLRGTEFYLDDKGIKIE